MTSIKTAAAAAALLIVASGTAAQAQTQPYGSNQSSSQGEQVLGAILGALFGANQSMDDQWRRGLRPLYNGRTQFESRLSAAVRDRTITQDQAARFRSDYADLVTLETRYYSDRQFSTAERTDLNDRYSALTRRLDTGYDDGYGSGYGTIADGRTAFEARVDASLRDRNISRTEATRLKTDYATLIRLETTYQRDGISSRERADLDSQLRALNERVGDDYDGGYGSGSGDYRTQLGRIESAITSGERSGQISRTEADRLRTEHGDLARLEAAYASGGYNSDESSYLSRRIGELDSRVRNTRR